jgi:D-ribose pyranase
MKDRGILHPRLAAVLAAMGHGDVLCVADAGLPVPPDVERIDLAYSPGEPAFASVVTAILRELRVEAYTVAREAASSCPQLLDELAAHLPDARVEEVPHEQLKARSRHARAVVRTGEFTPYANVLLRSGVDFTTTAA